MPGVDYRMTGLRCHLGHGLEQIVIDQDDQAGWRVVSRPISEITRVRRLVDMLRPTR